MQKTENNNTTITDEQLLIRYRETGDRELFTELVGRYERELYAYLCRYLGDSQQAEDVFQATFLQIHLKCEQFEEGRRFRPWLYTVATNQAIDAQRRNRRHKMASLDRMGANDENDSVGAIVDLLVSDNQTPLHHVSELERAEWVQGAINGLSEQMKSVIVLVYYQGMKYREAADVLSIPVGTVKSRIHAAILKLNEHWKQTHNE